MKVSAQKIFDISTYPEVNKVFKKKIPQFIVCHQEGDLRGLKECIYLCNSALELKYFYSFGRYLSSDCVASRSSDRCEKAKFIPVSFRVEKNNLLKD